jgi:hypothetical protein
MQDRIFQTPCYGNDVARNNNLSICSCTVREKMMIQQFSDAHQHKAAFSNWITHFKDQPQTPKMAHNRVDNSIGAELKRAGLRLGFVSLRQEDWLFRQGNAGDALYFVEKGAV